MEFKEYKEKLKQYDINDFIVSVEQFGDILNFWIYGTEKDAIKQHNNLINSVYGDDRTFKISGV